VFTARYGLDPQIKKSALRLLKVNLMSHVVLNHCNYLLHVHYIASNPDVDKTVFLWFNSVPPSKCKDTTSDQHKTSCPLLQLSQQSIQ
jgi:hypothetical protein